MNNKDVLELIGLIDELNPVIDGGIDTITPYFDRFIDYIIDKKAYAIKKLMDKHGFTREEAIMLTVDMQTQMLNALKDKNNG